MRARGSTRIAISVALLSAIVATDSFTQIPLEAGSNGNLITVLVQNSHVRLPLQGIMILGDLPPELEAPASQLEFLFPTVTWPGEFTSASFVLDVDPFATPGLLPPVDLKLSRDEGDTLVFPMIIDVVPPNPLGADVRVEFQVDTADAGLSGSESLVARIDDTVTAPLLDDGVPPDATAGDQVYSGSWVATAGSNRWHRYEVEVDGTPECNDFDTPEQRLFRVEDLLFDALSNPQVLPTATLDLCTIVAVPDPKSQSALFASRPNPFHSFTRFAWTQNRSATVELTIYDSRGRRVAQPLAPRQYGPGEHWMEWNASDFRGKSMAAGVYWLELRIDGVRRDTRTVLLVR